MVGKQGKRASKATANSSWYEVEGWAWDGPHITTIQVWRKKPPSRSGSRPAGASKPMKAKKAMKQTKAKKAKKK